MSGCEKPSLEPDGSGLVAASSANQEAEKGNGKNPFSVANMRQAYANLMYPPDECIDCYPPLEPTPDPTPVYPTHLYVRFKPADTDQIADLDDLGFRLSWEPYDESVAAVTTVNYDSDEIPWIYSVVPVGTPLPGHIQREQLEELFLFTPEDGDVRDEDPWEPTPEPPPPACQTQWDPSCNCYLECPQLRTSGATTATKKPNKQTEATKKLKLAGVVPADLYDEALRISGHGDEARPKKPKKGEAPVEALRVRYHPRGHIFVEDTELRRNVPLRGVKVESRRWFNLDSDYTDNLGYFEISSGYRSMVKMSLKFKSELATTRGIISGVRPWQSVLPINSDISKYTGEAMQSIDYAVTFQGGADKGMSKGASTWTAATLFHTLADAHAFAAARGMPGPERGINVWLFPDFPKLAGGYGSAPMLRKISETSIASNFVTVALAGSPLPHLAAIKVVVQRQLPDVFIWYNDPQGALPSDRLVPLLFHELAHTQHYTQAGNTFWTDYIQHIIGHLGYGRKSDAGSGRIAISEGWGNYEERLFTADKYRNTSIAGNQLATRVLAELENQVPSDTGDGWLIYGLYHDMTDHGTEPPDTGVIDDVTAYTPATALRGLTSATTSVGQYRTMTLILNNQLQEPQLNRLVTSYRW